MTRVGRCSARASGLAVAAAVLLAFAGSANAAEFRIGGYAKLDMVWADAVVGNGTTTTLAPAPKDIPLDGEPEADHDSFVLDAREVRLNFTTTGETAGVKLRGFVEFDFFTNEGTRFVTNSRGPRLRHALGQATLPSGFFLVIGQTTSTFVNVDTGAPSIIDFGTPPGALTGRQPLLRVGYPIGNLTLMAGIESHSVNPDGDTSANIFGENQELPLFAARAVWKSSVLTVETAGAVAQNRALFAATGAEDTETAWGVQGGVKIPIGPLSLVGHVHLLDGLNRFNNNHFLDAVVNPGAGTINNITTLGWFAGASWAVRPTTTVNALYSWSKADEESFYTGDNDEEFSSIHVNVLQKFWGNMQVGLEYERKTRETFSGLEGDLNRIHAAVWYFF